MMMQEKPKEKKKAKDRDNILLSLDSDDSIDTRRQILSARARAAQEAADTEAALADAAVGRRRKGELSLAQTLDSSDEALAAIAVARRRKAELSLSQAVESSEEDEEDNTLEEDTPLLAQLTEEEAKARYEEAQKPKQMSRLQQKHQLQDKVPFHHKQYPPAETGESIEPPAYPSPVATNPPHWQTQFRASMQTTLQERRQNMNFYGMDYTPAPVHDFNTRRCDLPPVVNWPLAASNFSPIRTDGTSEPVACDGRDTFEDATGGATAVTAEAVMTGVDKKTNKKKSKSNTGRATPTGEKKKAAARNKQELHPALAAFRFEHKKRLLIGEEMNPRNKENPGPWKVAQFVEVGSEEQGNYNKFVLNDLTSDNLRKVASNFGCKALSSATKFDCRLKMASRCIQGEAYNLSEVPNSTTLAKDKKRHTYLRIINACFHPDHCERFITLNDRKTREDFEASGGGSPVKQFWVDVSEFVNDRENNEVLCHLHFSAEEEDERMHDIVCNMQPELNDFDQTTHASCAQMMKDAMRAREKVRFIAMKASGSHSSDFWSFCRMKTLTVHQGCKVPPEVAYYVDLMCQEHPAIEGAFEQYLKDDLRSDSTKIPESASLLTSSTSSLTAASSATRVNENMAKIFQNTSSGIIAIQAARAESDASRVEEERTTRQWAEYDRLAERVISLRESTRPGALQLLRNIAKRVRALEIDLNIAIEESIVCHLIPPSQDGQQEVRMMQVNEEEDEYDDGDIDDEVEKLVGIL
ncbi:unknown protein [Seminavis robusta]|uniref:Uncharacterized protein n=1 Tax=Seminavis robusta TaxID=568900 RepID=A0A9N8EDV0_9STRA|nr:unknown protein [Seminavis robusta]|eukprot:Sro858_g211790.1 n/a (753) ;mRNA; r:6830-9088